MPVLRGEAQHTMPARGMADDVTDHPPMPEQETSYETPLTPEQVQKARKRDYELRLKHGALPTGDEGGAADIHTYRYARVCGVSCERVGWGRTCCDAVV